MLTPTKGSSAEQADLEKVRLEAKQRQERTIAEAAGAPWQPRWFEKVLTSNQAHYPLWLAMFCLSCSC